MRLGPGQSSLKFLVIVNLQLHAAEHLGHIYPLGADAQVVLEELRIAERAHDAHGNGADAHIGFVLHHADSAGAAGEPENFFLNVAGNGGIRDILDVVTVDREGRQASLVVSGHNGGQIYRAGTLGAVKAPNRLNGGRIQVHRLAAVAPAGSNAQGGAHILRGELLGAAGRLLAAADGAVGNDAFHRSAVWITDLGFNQLLGHLSHLHGFFFQAFPHAEPAAVNDGADANGRIVCHKI